MDKKVLLSTLWIFLTVNFIFCDVFTLHYSDDLQKILSGKVGDINITQEFLLASSFMMEIPMVMILLSRVLSCKFNRILNMIAGLLLVIVQAGSLVVDVNTLHYWFFSIIEVATCISIVWIAFKWDKT